MTRHRHMVMKVSSFSVTATFQKTTPVYTTDRNKGNPTDLLAEVAFGQYAINNYMAKIAEIHKLFTVVITVTNTLSPHHVSATMEYVDCIPTIPFLSVLYVFRVPTLSKIQCLQTKRPAQYSKNGEIFENTVIVYTTVKH